MGRWPNAFFGLVVDNMTQLVIVTGLLVGVLLIPLTSSGGEGR